VVGNVAEASPLLSTPSVPVSQKRSRRNLIVTPGCEASLPMPLPPQEPAANGPVDVSIVNDSFLNDLDKLEAAHANNNRTELPPQQSDSVEEPQSKATSPTTVPLNDNNDNSVIQDDSSFFNDPSFFDKLEAHNNQPENKTENNCNLNGNKSDLMEVSFASPKPPLPLPPLGGTRSPDMFGDEEEFNLDCVDLPASQFQMDPSIPSVHQALLNRSNNSSYRKAAASKKRKKSVGPVGPPLPPQFVTAAEVFAEPAAKRSSSRRTKKGSKDNNKKGQKTKDEKKKSKFKLAYTNRKAAKLLSVNSELSKDELTGMSEEEKLQLASWGLPQSVLTVRFRLIALVVS
jgi:hypothetical protein